MSDPEANNVDAAGDEVSIAASTAVEVPPTDRRSIKREQRRELFRSPSFLIGAAIALFWLVCALFPSLITNGDELNTVRDSEGKVIVMAEIASLLPEGVEPSGLGEPGGATWLGVDQVGRDVFARVVYGADNVLITSPIAALLAVLFGAILGLIMGYYRGVVDEVLSRLVEAILSLPIILLALMVVLFFGSSRIVTILTIAGLFTPVVARTVRAAVMSEAQLDYVTSAKLRGEPGSFIMMREIFPNISNILIVEFTVRVGYAIFTVATLSFLGFSAGEATDADWGRDISETYNFIQAGQWWPSIFPAIAIASLVIGINLIADSVDKVYSS